MTRLVFWRCYGLGLALPCRGLTGVSVCGKVPPVPLFTAIDSSETILHSRHDERCAANTLILTGIRIIVGHLQSVM